MIILDANILKGVSLRGPEAELLRTIRTSGVERVAAPWIVFEELAAQQVLLYGAKHETALDAVTALDKATPWAKVALPVKASPEMVRGYWRKRYTELAEPLQTSLTAYEQALFREANLLAPCKTINSGKAKTGARDAAIWLTAVEYAREHPQESVYFVTNDSDFLDHSTSLRHPLDEDLKGLEQRFVLFTSLDDVVSKFATEIEAPEDDVRSVLAKPPAGAAAVRSARHSGNFNFVATAVREERRLVEVPVTGHFLNSVSLALSSVSGIRAYEIAGHKWCTATARWLFSGYVPQPYSPTPTPLVNWAWETRLLLSPTAPEKGVTVLRGGAFTPISPEDVERLPPIFISGATTDLERELAATYREMAARNEALARELEDLGLPSNTRVLRLVQSMRTFDAAAERILGLFQGDTHDHGAEGIGVEIVPEEEDD
ncbi:PIN domain-containing protein [Streptomyces europaeiscabiei]|uniref:PIN domain-containing protein n=1 Tax=Streptomyces europaeiscabiei TaxID=146819 RepID=UPI002E11F0A1|nr:PIN domain-containing protein [Streptomyces europaeiscabiei]